MWSHIALLLKKLGRDAMFVGFSKYPVALLTVMMVSILVYLFAVGNYLDMSKKCSSLEEDATTATKIKLFSAIMVYIIYCIDRGLRTTGS